MSKIIYFKVIDITHTFHTVILTFSDDLFCRNIPVRLLSLFDQCNILLDFIKHFLIFLFSGRVNGRLHPFIKITISKYRSVKITFGFTRTDSEVLQNMTDIFALKHMLQLRYCACRTCIKSLFPESACPLYIKTIYRMYLCIYRISCICQHLILLLFYSVIRPFCTIAALIAAAPNLGLDTTGFLNSSCKYSST